MGVLFIYLFPPYVLFGVVLHSFGFGCVVLVVGSQSTPYIQAGNPPTPLPLKNGKGKKQRNKLYVPAPGRKILCESQVLRTSKVLVRGCQLSNCLRNTIDTQYIFFSDVSSYHKYEFIQTSTQSPKCDFDCKYL